MMTCKEVTHLVATSQDDNLGLMRRLQLRIHLMMCHNCRNYIVQIRAIGEAARRLCQQIPVADSDLTRIETEILKHL